MKAVLFDLDGTLLPMDMDEFTNGYFKLLAKNLHAHGYEEEKLIRAVWRGTGAMVRNDGSATNEEVFWRDFEKTFGERANADKPLFEAFYAGDFQQAKRFCGFAPEAKEVVHFLKDAGYRVALATNPLFPSIATESRIRWAGLQPEDFELYTTYENFSYCKPNLEYYREVVRRMGLEPEDCLMVGNDADEDMVVRQLGMDVFLLTDCLINKSELDIAQFPHGDFAALRRYLSDRIGA
ncbi:MAG: HAD family hydrolase [Christensenellales bacterium]